MKIALICTEKLPVPPISGGAIQLYIEGILPELSKYHDITVYSIKHPQLPDEEVIKGVKYIRVSAENKTMYIKNLKQSLLKDFDLIHVFNRPHYVLSLAKDFPNNKFSLSLHNEMFHNDKIPIAMAAECIKKVEFITTVSNYIADGVKNLYPIAQSKTFTVYSGVDVDIYKPISSVEGAEIKEKLKQKYDLEDKKVIIFVGRLSIKKGVDKLFNAMKKVMDLRSDVALVVIGSKWYGSNTTDKFTESIDTLSKTLKGPIIFTGFIPPSEIPEYYNLGDIFVCPSQWNEPLARVHYEAMAAGLPIITTNRGGNAEVVKGFDNGIVIDDFSNVDAFVKAITDLLDNPLKALEFGQAGRSLAEGKYNWKRVASELLKQFNEVENRTVKVEIKTEETENNLDKAKNKANETENNLNKVKIKTNEAENSLDEVKIKTEETEIDFGEVKIKTNETENKSDEIKNKTDDFEVDRKIENTISLSTEIKNQQVIKESEIKLKKNPYLTNEEEYYLNLYKDYLD